MTQLNTAQPMTHPLPVTELGIDRSDPFFFDHPLDHVPGMLLLCAAADLARRGGGVPHQGRLRATANFRALSGFSPAPVLHGEVAAGGRHHLRITQDGTLVADGWYEAAPEPAPEPGTPHRSPGRRLVRPHRPLQAAQASSASLPALVPAVPALVHRLRPENVMLGEPRVTAAQVDAAVLLPPVGHPLWSRRPGRRSVRALIEAGRQLITWLMHRVGGWPLGTRMLWLKLTADLPLGLPWSAPVTLRWHCTAIPGNRVRLRFEVIAGDGHGGADRTVGSLIYLIMGLSPGGDQPHPTRSAA
jgi:hypothetical protein